MQRKDIIQALNGLVDSFTTASENLFEVTRAPQRIEYEKALYLGLYVKPSKRLAKIFSTDREVLVIFTNFSDQQQRTIALAREQLSDADGRLEVTLGIIVHGDAD